MTFLVWHRSLHNTSIKEIIGNNEKAPSQISVMWAGIRMLARHYREIASFSIVRRSEIGIKSTRLSLSHPLKASLHFFMECAGTIMIHGRFDYENVPFSIV
ncbi:hypothetical protein M9Y10_045063 [Tritrichomonas musculus]|uniref:Uncharacterized protein n=1 Tax=Tritrichomonas musculus TaxID=1915356 RepID=A0ABR2JUJ9_9EUKA